MSDEVAHQATAAIAAAACRLPGGICNVTDLDNALVNATPLISDVPPNRWSSDFHDPTGQSSGTTRSHRGSFLDEVDAFDASFFGIGGHEADAMDPQHRLVLEVAWEAMRQVEPTRSAWSRSRTGVFVGLLSSDYRSLHLAQDGIGSIGAHYAPGNEASFAAGRLAFHLDLAGPAVGITTACSSSLVALTAAADALRLGRIDYAVVAGVNLLLSPELSIYMSRIGALSPTGSCQPFRLDADGVVRGDGCAAIVLTRPADCSDPLALLRGYGTNHDGLSAGLTAPRSSAQRELLAQVWGDCGLDGAGIDFVEAHGTGTSLGDPVEVSALAEVLGTSRNDHGPLPIGSHKANFGHLDAAAGLVGLLKVISITRTGLIPAQPDGGTPIELPPALTLATEPVRIAAESRPIRAAVSAFGLSGTNAHVVVEAAPTPTPTSHEKSITLLVSGTDSHEVDEALTEFDQAVAEAAPDEVAWLTQASSLGPHGPVRAAFAVDVNGQRSALAQGRPRTERPLVAVITAFGSSPSRDLVDQMRSHPMWEHCAAACSDATGLALEELAAESPRTSTADKLLTGVAATVRLAELAARGLTPTVIVGEGFLAHVSNATTSSTEPLDTLFAAGMAEAETTPGVTAIIAAPQSWIEQHLTEAEILSDRGESCVIALADPGDLHQVVETCNAAGHDVQLVDLSHRYQPNHGESVSAQLRSALSDNPDGYVLDISCRSRPQPLSGEPAVAGIGLDWTDQTVARAWVEGVLVRQSAGDVGRRPSAGGERLPAMRWQHQKFWTPCLRVPSRDATEASPVQELPAGDAPDHDAMSRIRTAVDRALCIALHLPEPDLPGPEDPLLNAGLTSLGALGVADELAHELGTDIPATIVLEHPTRASLTQAVMATAPTRGQAQAAPPTPPSEPSLARPPSHEPKPETDRGAQQEPVAVVSHAFRLPGATDDDALWQMFQAGEATATPLATSRPGADAWEGEAEGALLYASYLDGIDQYDHTLFSMSPAEAKWVDPQHRLLLETSWQALGRSGFDLSSAAARRRTGVFVGLDSSDYGQLAASRSGAGCEYYGTGNSPSAASGRISHAFDLGGPSFTLDTACSSSLAAVHTAIGALLRKECDQALVGAANLIITPTITRSMTRAGALAPDGRCKAFSAAADGYGRGDGVVVVTLKRLADAVRDGDRIEAVVEGSALTHDGRGGGFTVPSVEAQTAVVHNALIASGRTPSEVVAVEAHGTGTALGDPLELRGLAQVFEGTELAVGTAKAIFGHLEAAAGLLGLLKVLLSFEHDEFPAQPLPEGPTTEFDWPSHKLTPSTGLALGPDDAIGISAFGFTGTNTHIVATPRSPRASAQQEPYHWLIPVSGHTEKMCRDRLREIAESASNWRTEHLAGAIALLVRSPRHLRYRTCVHGATAEDTLETLREIRETGDSPKIVTVEPESHCVDLDSPDRDVEQAFLEGKTPTWHAGKTCSAPQLPAYPHERVSHWLPESASAVATSSPVESPPADPFSPRKRQSQRKQFSVDDYAASIAQVFSEILQMNARDLDPDLGFFDLGVDSIQAVPACERLSDLYGVDVDPTATFEHATVRRLAAHIAELAETTNTAAEETPPPASPVHPALVDRDAAGPGVQAHGTGSTAAVTLETAMAKAQALLEQGSPS